MLPFRSLPASRIAGPRHEGRFWDDFHKAIYYEEGFNMADIDIFYTKL